MALTTKLEVVSVSKDGKTLTVKDTTGAYNITTNPSGYGTPNPAIGDFSKVIFGINSLPDDDTDRAYATYSSSTSPTAAAVMGGADVAITSAELGVTGADISAFSDGVLDIEMYNVLAAEIAATGAAGAMIITSADFGGIQLLPAVVIAGKVYKVDTAETNTSTTIYLTTALAATVTAVSGAYLADVKALVISEGEACLVSKIGKVAEGTDCTEQIDIDELFQLMMFKFAAQIDFDCANYAKAHSLATAVAAYCSTLTCDCG